MKTRPPVTENSVYSAETVAASSSVRLRPEPVPKLRSPETETKSCSTNSPVPVPSSRPPERKPGPDWRKLSRSAPPSARSTSEKAMPFRVPSFSPVMVQSLPCWGATSVSTDSRSERPMISVTPE